MLPFIIWYFCGFNSYIQMCHLFVYKVKPLRISSIIIKSSPYANFTTIPGHIWWDGLLIIFLIVSCQETYIYIIIYWH